MAIRQRTDRGMWQVYYRNPWTKKQETACYATLKEAQQADDLVKYRLRWEPEFFRPAEEPEQKQQSAADTLGGIVFAYLQDRKLPAMGVKTVMYAVKEALVVIGKKPASMIGADDIKAVLAKVQSKHGDTTTACKLVRLKVVLRWAVKHGLLAELPSWPELPPIRYEHFVPPTQDEISRLLQVAPAHVQRSIIIGVNLGVRIGPCELFKMRWSDFDLKSGVCHVRAAKKNPTEPVRDVPIRAALLPLFRKWKAEDDAAGLDLVIHFRGKPIGRIANWKEMLQRAGITRRIRPYDLRHAFATELIASGTDIGTVAKLLGHANAVMTLRHYQHVMTAQKRTAVESLPDLPVCTALYAQDAAPLLQ